MFLLQAITTILAAAAAQFGQVIQTRSPPGAGSAYSKKTYQGILLSSSGANAGTANIVIQVSNDPLCLTSPSTAAWLTLGTIALTGSPSPGNPITDKLVNDENWMYTRAMIAQSGVTGTNISASLIMGA